MAALSYFKIGKRRRATATVLFKWPKIEVHSRKYFGVGFDVVQRKFFPSVLCRANFKPFFGLRFRNEFAVVGINDLRAVS